MPAAASAPPGFTRPQPAVVACALVVAGALVAAAASVGARQILLFALGTALGIVLYHAAFGFASAYRALIERREVRGVRAHLVMLAAATLLFAPALATGSLFGREVIGAVAPAGISVAAGAFLFGIGMQLAGGCGSGTLYVAGGGQGRMLVALAAFCAGSFWASLHMGFWQRQPAPPEIALGEAWGWPIAVVAQIVVLGALWLWLGRFDRELRTPSPRTGIARLVQGPWPLLGGALALALLNFATLATAGHPWSITWAFTLWGAKVARLFGWDPASVPFWNSGFQRDALEASVFADTTSLMDFGILAGAFLAAALAGRFVFRLKQPIGALAAAVLGGLAMGYGARIAYGCNIGAFFSGVASTSLHGWLWIAAALPGCWVGVKLREWFGVGRAKESAAPSSTA
jgi:uncharacterized membrane protein YedE/YeeE